MSGEESCEITEMEEGGATTRHRQASTSHSLSVTMTWGFEKAGVVCCSGRWRCPCLGSDQVERKAEVSHGGITAYWSTGPILFRVEDEASSGAAAIVVADNLQPGRAGGAERRVLTLPWGSGRTTISFTPRVQPRRGFGEQTELSLPPQQFPGWAAVSRV